MALTEEEVAVAERLAELRRLEVAIEAGRAEERAAIVKALRDLGSYGTLIRAWDIADAIEARAHTEEGTPQ